MSKTILLLLECPECKKEFMQVKTWQKFCGKKCKYNQFWKHNITITMIEYKRLKQLEQQPQQKEQAI